VRNVAAEKLREISFEPRLDRLQQPGTRLTRVPAGVPLPERLGDDLTRTSHDYLLAEHTRDLP
jgi:hypothetical protein